LAVLIAEEALSHDSCIQTLENLHASNDDAFAA
jgi:hypothetical protein